MEKPIENAKALTHTPPITPTPLSTSAHELLYEIRNIHQHLSDCASLAPGNQVNALLTRLVGLCIKAYSTEFVTYFFNIEGVNALCTSLQPICAAAEGKLESHWTSKILEARTDAPYLPTPEVLQQFPYYTNYIDLSRLESSLLSAFLPFPQAATLNVAFLGSGPLPLSSICLLDNFPNANIVNVDRDAHALDLSEKLAKLLRIPSSRMAFVCDDIGDQTHSTSRAIAWETFDVVFLAALVGMGSSQKLSILASLARSLKPGTLVVARSARGLRTVLYPVLELGEELSNIGLDVLAELHPHTDVVNSVVVFRVRNQRL